MLEPYLKCFTYLTAVCEHFTGTEKSSDNDHDEVRKVLVVVMNNDIVSNLSARNKFSLALILG